MFLALAAIGFSSIAQAQPFNDRWNVPVPKPAPAPPAPAAQQTASKPKAKLPVSLPQALYLIRSTLLTLNDANRSGNYTVLRDLAAPGFQSRNTAADLARIFADLRSRNFDLFAVALMAPKLTAPPQLERNGMLRLTGYFPTQPLQIKFDMLFANVAQHWRLFGLSVATPQAPANEAKPAYQAKTAPKPQKQ
jgi:hypothetical protein